VWAQTLWHFYDPWIYSHRMTSASIFVDEDAECPVLDGFDFPCSGPHR
jgi:hypothetical protein